MGLDQFAYRTKKELDSPVDFKIDYSDIEEIEYWRKHPNLHGWMEKLYRDKGGADEMFNNTPVELTQEDIDSLAEALIDFDLPYTTGFFFGQSDTSADQHESDLSFCKMASKSISEGYRVFYDSSW